MEQRTPEWYAARLGKVTASSVGDLMTRTKTGWGACRENLMSRLIVERLTGQPADTYQSKEMLWGIETEAQARAAYEFDQDCDVELIGFVPHPTIADSGCSPDGYIGNFGLVEIKCPNTATHIEALLGERVPLKYQLQMQWQMACTNRPWCDYVSFDPRMPMHLQLYVTRCERDESSIAQLTQAVTLFLRELHTKLELLHGRLAVKVA